MRLTCDSAQMRPGWYCTSIHWTRAPPEPFPPDEEELLLRGTPNTFSASVRESFTVAMNDFPVRWRGKKTLDFQLS